jgi:DNA polymerase (family X)
MNNPAIAAIFDQMADLLDFKGENPFRVNAYRRAARAVSELRDDVADLAGRNELRKVQGVGDAIAQKIKEYLATGQMQAHQDLLAQFPASLPKLLQIPGLGPKKVAALFSELKVASMDDLRKAIESGAVAQLPHFGNKTAEKLLAGIRFIEQSSERTPLTEAWPLADSIRESVAALPGVTRAELAGSLRRGCETVGDIDVLCAAEAQAGPDVIAAFTKMPQAGAVLAAGETKGSILVHKPKGGDLQVDLRVVPKECFGAALQYFTGSKQHNVRLRELAVRRGWRLNEYGLFEGEKSLAGEDEAGIYERLGLPFVPPELREDRGEFDCRDSFDRLITFADMKSDLHMHTTTSDGRATLEEMVEAARAKGYAYIAITDHSRSSPIANGLTRERLMGQIEEIRRLNERLTDITVLTGTECDILPDGTLDWPDAVLAQVDWVVASIHTAQQQERSKLMKRCMTALENPYVCVLGHPSGRLLGERQAMDLDWDELIRTAARTGTALEVNSSRKRLDLNDVHVRMAMDAGCWITIDADAHFTFELDFVRNGVQAARRGWATRDRVLNTFPLEQLRAWVAKKRGS